MFTWMRAVLPGESILTWIRLVLTRRQWAYATCIAGLRNEVALERHYRSQYGLDGDDPVHHIYHAYGACSEYACGIAFDLPWPLGTWEWTGGPDLRIGSIEIDVKHTAGDNGRLWVPTEGRPDWYYVLATGYPPILDIRGWMLGEEAFANKPKFFRKLSPNPKRSSQYYIDQCDVHPIETLLDLINAEKRRLSQVEKVEMDGTVTPGSSRISTSTTTPPTVTSA